MIEPKDRIACVRDPRYLSLNSFEWGWRAREVLINFCLEQGTGMEWLVLNALNNFGPEYFGAGPATLEEIRATLFHYAAEPNSK